MSNNYKPTVVWFQAITCNGNTHSLLSSNSNRFELFLNSFNLIFHPSLTIDLSLEEVIKNEDKIDYLLVEGSISKNKNFFNISNASIYTQLQKLIQKANYVIAVGSCASFGGIHSKFEKVDDIKGVIDYFPLVKNLKHRIINLTGCPIHPEWLLQTMFALKVFGKVALDSENRPKELYSNLTHHGCTRNEYFEWKVESKSFGVKEGCLFYDQGCRGPLTHSSCNKILWNEVSSKTRVGMPCIGCTESTFPRDNMLETKKNIGIPFEVPLGVSKRAYLSITGVAKTFKIDRLSKKLMD